MIELFWAWVIGNYKGIGLLLLIAGVAGYVAILRHSVQKQELAIAAREADIATLKKDLDNAKVAISSMKEGMKTFQGFVNEALVSLKTTQNKINTQNRNLQRALDNIAIIAVAAKRILDAPTVPFFMGDNVAGSAILLGVDNGVYRFGVLPPLSPTH